MKRPSFRLIWNIVLGAIVISAILRAGYDKRLQLGHDTGRTRKVHSSFEVPFWKEAPEETTLSNWLKTNNDEDHWRLVGKIKGSLKKSPNIARFRGIIAHLDRVGSHLSNSTDRQKYARFILSEFGSEPYIALMFKKCSEVDNRVYKMGETRSFEETPLTFSELESVWLNLPTSD